MGGAGAPGFPIGDDEELCETVFHGGSFLELRPQVFPPAVYHDQQGAAASNFQQPLEHPRSPRVPISSSQRKS